MDSIRIIGRCSIGESAGQQATSYRTDGSSACCTLAIGPAKRENFKMSKLCALRIVESIQGAGTASAYVNPLLVRFIRPSAGNTVIYFDGQHTLNIAEPVEQVQTAIDTALAQ
jgi:hypothetical protein